jgi:hypothetical protein
MLNLTQHTTNKIIKIEKLISQTYKITTKNVSKNKILNKILRRRGNEDIKIFSFKHEEI